MNTNFIPINSYYFDSDPCIIISPCLNGGNCTNPSNGTYTCGCADGYSETNCQHEGLCYFFFFFLFLFNIQDGRHVAILNFQKQKLMKI